MQIQGAKRKLGFSTQPNTNPSASVSALLLQQQVSRDPYFILPLSKPIRCLQTWLACQATSASHPQQRQLKEFPSAKVLPVSWPKFIQSSSVYHPRRSQFVLAEDILYIFKRRLGSQKNPGDYRGFSTSWTKIQWRTRRRLVPWWSGDCSKMQNNFFFKYHNWKGTKSDVWLSTSTKIALFKVFSIFNLSFFSPLFLYRLQFFSWY